MLLSSPLLLTEVQAQFQIRCHPDTSHFIPKYRNPMLLSLGLISGGIATYHSSTKEKFQAWVLGHIQHDRTIEDYLQHGSYGVLVGAQLSGYHPMHTVKGQLIYALMANVGAVGLTSLIKEAINERRPNGGHLSFPSGHTTHAFAAASVLYWEYKDTHPVLAYSGYSFAVATGLLRIVHNRHWVNDVLAGAGIGILIPALVYYFDPFPGMKWSASSDKIGCIPVAEPGGYGLRFSISI